VPALAAAAGIRLADPGAEQLAPRAVADELRRAWPRFAAGCAAAGPTLFVIEDMHWSGHQLREMIDVIVTQSVGPLLLVTTARGEASSSPDLAVIALRALGADQSRRLLAHLGRDLDPVLAERILGRAEGNPFFLEELVLHQADRGGGAPPDTIAAVLAARVDSLPPAQKRVLQHASVVGRVFGGSRSCGRWVPARSTLNYPGSSGPVSSPDARRRYPARSNTDSGTS
jgi:hypothetical protein